MTTDLHPSELRGPKFLFLDLPGRNALPVAWRWIVGAVVAVGLSLLACFVLAQLATALDRSLLGYGHFEFSDYSRLTVVGVLAACVGWPVVCCFSTRARRLYLWLGTTATVVSLAPDAWILHLGQPAAGVATLVAMHVALGIITIASMVFIAPQSHPIRSRGK
jgi:hypothetical protein